MSSDIGATFAALADPGRRRMLGLLGPGQTATATELARQLPITRQAVAKHLATLQAAGLVEAHREGRETRYTLTPAPLGEAVDWLAETGAQWDERLARLAARAARDAGSGISV